MLKRYTLTQKLCVLALVLILMVSSYFLFGGHASGDAHKNFGQSPEVFVRSMSVRLAELMVKRPSNAPYPAVLPVYTVSSVSAYTSSDGEAFYLRPDKEILVQLLLNLSLPTISYFIEYAISRATQYTEIVVWKQKSTGMIGFIDATVKKEPDNSPHIFIPIFDSIIYGALRSEIGPDKKISREMTLDILEKLVTETTKKKTHNNEFISYNLIYQDDIMYFFLTNEQRKTRSLIVAKGMNLGEVYSAIGSSQP